MSLFDKLFIVLSSNSGNTILSSVSTFFLGLPLPLFGFSSITGSSTATFLGLPLPLFAGFTVFMM